MPSSSYSEKLDERVRRSLRLSIIEGSFYFVMVGFGESFFLPFGIFLKASDFQIALMGTLPLAAASILQLSSGRVLTRFSSRRSMIAAGAFLQALTFLPLVGIALLPGSHIYLVTACVVAYFTFNMLIGPPWGSWMGDMVPEGARGRYFSSRNRALGIATLAAMVTAGMILRGMGGQKTTAFAILFSLAFCARCVSVWFLTRQWEPPRTADAPRMHFSQAASIPQLRPFRRLALFLALMNASVYVSAPFFPAYILKECGFGYGAYVLLQCVIILTKYLSLPLWGRLSDRYGSSRVLALNAALLPFVPLVWILPPSLPLFMAAQVVAGWVWSGFELSSFNVVLDNTSQRDRAPCFAYYHLLNGIGLAGAALLATLVVPRLSLLGSPYLFAFAFSGGLRLCVALAFRKGVQEIRTVEPTTVRAMLLRPFIEMSPRAFIHLGLSALRSRKNKND